MNPATLDFLKTLPLLAGVDDAGLRDLYGVMGLVQYTDDGHVIFDVGDKPDGAYVVVKGACALTRPTDGREIVRLGKGAVVGELCLVRPEPRTLRLSVVEAADVLTLHGPGFARLRDEGHPAAWQVLRNVGLMACERLRDTNELLELEWRGETREAATIAPLAAPKKKATAWQRLLRLVGAGKEGAA